MDIADPRGAMPLFFNCASDLANSDRPPRRPTMFTHVHLGSDDVARSKRFYDALFDALGGAAS